MKLVSFSSKLWAMKWSYAIVILFFLQGVFAGPRGGGGMDSGGGSGLSLRLRKANALAIEVLQTVKPEDLKGEDESLIKFYSKNRNEMIEEVQASRYIIKAPYEVFLMINGRKVFKAMTTSLQRNSPITVSESVRTEDVSELAANILHEVGHHFGIPQSEDPFLDALSTLLVEKALQLNPVLSAGTKHCLTGEEMMQLAAGKWKGTATFIPSIKPYPVEIEIAPTGHYTGRSICKDTEDCPPAFYYVPDDIKDPRKKLRFSNSCGDGSGQIILVFGIGTSRPLELKFVTLSPDAKNLEFQMIMPEAIVPLEMKLQRQK